MAEYVGMKAPPKVSGGHIRKGWQKRMGVSDSLKTNDMWKAIGHDPYGNPDHDDKEDGKRRNRPAGMSAAEEAQVELAETVGLTSGRTPGACKTCGLVGHLAFQCRNNIEIGLKTKKAVDLNEPVSDDPDSDEEIMGARSRGPARPRDRDRGRERSRDRDRRKKKKRARRSSRSRDDRAARKKEKKDRRKKKKDRREDSDTSSSR